MTDKITLFATYCVRKFRKLAIRPFSKPALASSLKVNFSKLFQKSVAAIATAICAVNLDICSIESIFKNQLSNTDYTLICFQG